MHWPSQLHLSLRRGGFQASRPVVVRCHACAGVGIGRALSTWCYWACAADGALSAVESLFQRHMQRSLSSYQGMLEEIAARFERRCASTRADFDARISDLQASLRVSER